MGSMPDRNQGGVPLALLILIGVFVVIVGGIAVSCDALFEDEQEQDDLGHGRIVLISHDYDGGYDDGGCDYGNCGEREEDYGDGSCKYFCPEGRFDDSPVQDSFNICLPGSQCHFDGDRQQEGEQPQ